MRLATDCLPSDEIKKRRTENAMGTRGNCIETLILLGINEQGKEKQIRNRRKGRYLTETLRRDVS